MRTCEGSLLSTAEQRRSVERLLHVGLRDNAKDPTDWAHYEC
jgi:hypothetical protein